jgi:hypothetical protein
MPAFLIPLTLALSHPGEGIFEDRSPVSASTLNVSRYEGLRMTCPRGRSVKCTNVLWFDLGSLYRAVWS